MDSEDSRVKEYFKNWTPLSKIEKNPLEHLKKIAGIPGVYLLRKKGKFGRLVGNSDILYIGSSTDLYQRIYENYLLGRGGPTTKRIHTFLKKKNYLDETEVAWCSESNFKDIEKKLREKYENDHHELPPWNRQK